MYVLTTKKSALSYRSIFEYIEQNLYHLEPSEIITDFEAGLRNALNTVYPNTVLRGCWFHYCAAIRKKNNELGLRTLIRSNSDAKFVEKSIMSLPLLSPKDILVGFEYIKNSVQGELLEHLKPLLSYVDSYWLKKQVKRLISIEYPCSIHVNMFVCIMLIMVIFYLCFPRIQKTQFQ